MQATNVSISYDASEASKIRVQKSIEEDAKDALDILLAEYASSPDSSTMGLPEWLTIRLKWAGKR